VSCSGLHCAGCGGGSAAPVLAFAVFCGADWVVTHIVEVAITSAVCGALAVTAVVALMRWADRRDERRAAAWRQLHVRVVPIGTCVPDSVTSAERPALPFRDLHIHLDGAPSAEQAAVIRQALNGRNHQS